MKSGLDELQLDFKPNATADLLAIIPTPSQVLGRPAKLVRVFLLAFTSEQAKFNTVIIGTFNQRFLVQTLTLQGDLSTISAANTFVPDTPVPVASGLAVESESAAFRPTRSRRA